MTDIETIASLAKRRGFAFQSSDIYGGLGSVWDYGPLGVELKNNIKRAWWRSVVYERDDMVGLDAGILMNRLVWKYSGHEATFSDPLVDCRKCKSRLRADKLERVSSNAENTSAEKALLENALLTGLLSINAAIGAKLVKCSVCGSTDLTEARQF